MIRLKKYRYSPVLALILCAAIPYQNTTTIDAPPPGITPTTASLAQVRALHARAIAGNFPAAYRMHGTIEAEGVNGTSDEVVRADDFRLDEVLGPAHDAYGTYQGRTWQQNGTGEIITVTGIHHYTKIDQEAETSPGAGSALLGEVTSPVHAYVVRIDPPGGRLEYVFYDESTGHIDRIERIEAGSRDAIDYDQFTAVGTRIIPWHTHESAGKTGNEQDRRIVSVDTSTPVTDRDVAPPQAVNPLSLPPAPYTIPAKILSDRIIVRARINGHAVNLQLDSGSSSVLIDQSVLDAVGIHSYGKSKAATAGIYTAGHAIVPQIDIGDATLKNVNVESAPFAVFADDRTVVAGLLGFDFIDAAVVKVDYVAGQVSLLDPATFTPPANATAVSIALDDLVPSLLVSIAGSNAPHMVLDTGADRSALFSEFTRANPQTTKDQGLGTMERDAYPFEEQFFGVGGRVTFRPVQVGPFVVAGVTFPTWLFTATMNAASFEYEDIDGLVGQDVLRYFDVYLDYPHERIYFVPNQRYRDRFS